MKKIALYNYIFLILSALFLSCTDTDDDLQDIYLEDFLKKNDGTEWMLENDDLAVYIRLNNSFDQLIEQWRYDPELNCYNYNPNIFIPGNYAVLENSTHQLTIEGDAILSDYECMIFSREDNSLKVLIRISEWQEETVYFTLSTLQVDDLERCTDQEEKRIDWLLY